MLLNYKGSVVGLDAVLKWSFECSMLYNQQGFEIYLNHIQNNDAAGYAHTRALMAISTELLIFPKVSPYI